LKRQSYFNKNMRQIQAKLLSFNLDNMRKSLGAKTLLFPTPVLVVGTYDRDGNPDIMTAAWGGICCSGPPCLAVSIRKARLTYANIMEKKEFTVSIPSEAHVAEADYVGIVSGRDEDKFTNAGLTPVKAEMVDAPYVKEFPMHLECRMVHSFDLGQHTQFVGEILDVRAEDSVLSDGMIDVEKLMPFSYAPSVASYYGTGKRLGQGFNLGKRFSKK
jgi:flavin reductase (DIM6/NTAB) family NADH-FMN oxidoreductase RutF